MLAMSIQLVLATISDQRELARLKSRLTVCQLLLATPKAAPLLPTLMTIVPVPLPKLSCLKPYDAEPPAAVLQP